MRPVPDCLVGGTCLAIYATVRALQLAVLPWREVLVYGALATFVARMPLVGATPGYVYTVVLAVAMYLAVPRVQEYDWWLTSSSSPWSVRAS